MFTRRLILDCAERLLLILLAGPFLYAFAIALPMHPQFILLAASEAMGVGLILIRKPGEIAATPYAFAIAILGTALPLYVLPIGATALLPSWVTAIAAFAGLLVSVSAKLFLNRSFGIVAANRGIKRNGPYRLVRHPMYLGYIVTQASFLCAAFSLRNLLIYLFAWTFQVLRIIEEEKMLSRDPEYRMLSARVRFRLVPGVY